MSQVEIRLERESKPAPVEVSAENGIVTLRGYVDNETQRSRLDSAARDVPGVLAVNNLLEIRRPPTLTGAEVE